MRPPPLVPELLRTAALPWNTATTLSLPRKSLFYAETVKAAGNRRTIHFCLWQQKLQNRTVLSLLWVWTEKEACWLVAAFPESGFCVCVCVHPRECVGQTIANYRVINESHFLICFVKTIHLFHFNGRQLKYTFCGILPKTHSRLLLHPNTTRHYLSIKHSGLDQ